MGRDVENGGGLGAVQAHALRAPGIPRTGGSSTHDAGSALASTGAAIAATLRGAFAGRRTVGLAVHAGLTIVAGLVVLGAAVALIGDDPGTTNRILSFADLVGPDDAVGKIHGTVSDVMTRDWPAAVALAVGLVAVVWLASGYLRAFGRVAPAIGGAGAEGRSRMRVREVPLLATLGLSFAGVLVALLLTGPPARAAVEALGGGDRVLTLWSIGKWPLIAGVFVSLFLLLHCLIVRPHPAKQRVVSDSQLAAGALWAVAIVGFLFYLANFDSFDQTFGSAGSAIVSVLWLALFSVLYYGTPSLGVDGFGPVMPGLAVAVATFLAGSAAVALGASLLDPFSTTFGAVALGALGLTWLWVANFALLLGSTVDLELGRGQSPTPAEVQDSEPELDPEPEPSRPEARPLRAGPEGSELERIVRIALADDAAHRDMWSALPGGPDEVPSILTGLECDLNDWGFAYGVAWAVAKTRYPFESDRRVAERALEAATTVFGEYCAGENWSERLADRSRSS